MIEEPPLLSILPRGRRNRPTVEQIDAFREVPTGFVADAMGGSGALDYRIKPLPGLAARLVGPALTCDSGPADLLALMGALSQVQAGDVIVHATGPWLGCATLGDRVCGMARNAGAAGIVTDGLARDLVGIQDVGLPLFCQGLSPNSPFSKGPGTIGQPVTVGGHPVASGDMIVADADGVVVVPFALIDTVIARLCEIAALEEALDAKVADGLTLPGAIADLLASDQVREV
ncbi:RraA family protein [Oceanibium sediminis]|uniref:RraA family protein n=1 Tax=Oceanibium sediminis TaxID=2026339 RepID=UPI000DD348AF|nr:RraA family protein [Oceanibium sediminis]